MSPNTIQATYNSNYNGWTIVMDDDIDYEHDMIVELTDFTYDDCDEDGEYMGNFTSNIPKFKSIIHKYFPNHTVSLVDDTFST